MNIPKLIVKKSKINNKGLFSNSDILPETYLIEYTGEKISRQEEQRREIENDKKGVTYIFCLDENTCIDGSVGGNDSIYINHSCSPNCKLVRRNNRLYFYSRKFIKKGEELTVDYAFDKDSKKEMCNCKSSKCRGIMNEI